MPLGSRDFVNILKQHASDGVGLEVIKSALRPNPFDSSPQRSKRIREFIEGLSESDRETLSSLLQDAAEFSIAGALCVLDGVGGNYNGTFELYSFESDETKHLVNSENSEMLHDIYSELLSE